MSVFFVLATGVALFGSLTACAPKATCKPLTAPIQRQLSDPPGRIVISPKDEISALFDSNSLQTFNLNLSAEDLAFLDAQPAAEKYVRGEMTFKEKTYQNVGIRYKGSAGAWYGCLETPKDNPFDFSGPKKCPKLNLKVSFSKYNPDGRFLGVKKIQFHAMNSDAFL